MAKSNPETLAGAACVVLAVGFALLTAHCAREGDASSQLVAVQADFSEAGVRHDVNLRNKDGTTSVGDEVLVDAVFHYEGQRYRHSVPKSWVMGVVSTLPGRGTILIDPNDPAKAPRITPHTVIAPPLLACVFSVLLAVIFFLNAWRSRRSASPVDVH